MMLVCALNNIRNVTNLPEGDEVTAQYSWRARAAGIRDSEFQDTPVQTHIREQGPLKHGGWIEAKAIRVAEVATHGNRPVGSFLLAVAVVASVTQEHALRLQE